MLSLSSRKAKGPPVWVALFIWQSTEDVIPDPIGNPSGLFYNAEKLDP